MLLREQFVDGPFQRLIKRCFWQVCIIKYNIMCSGHSRLCIWNEKKKSMQWLYSSSNVDDEQTIVLEVKLAFSATSRTIKKYFMAAINVLTFEDGLELFSLIFYPMWRQFQRKIFCYVSHILLEFEHVWLSWLPLIPAAPHIRIWDIHFVY